MSDDPQRDRLRTRVALGALVGGGAGALTYALLRAYVYARGGGGAMTLLLRQQTVGYFQALAVSGFVGVALFLAVVALDETPEETERIERLLERAMVPLLLASGALYYLLP